MLCGAHTPEHADLLDTVLVLLAWFICIRHGAYGEFLTYVKVTSVILHHKSKRQCVDRVRVCVCVLQMEF